MVEAKLDVAPESRTKSLPLQPELVYATRSRYRAFRNVADIVIALGLLPLLLPWVAVISLAIWLDSPGPVFFRQQRVGRQGKLFTVLKFRTLEIQAPRYSEKIQDTDPRITRVGRLLRRTGLDELPQLFNVVRGEMALIGPRPEQLPLLTHYSDWQLLRHVVKPGITGWWQVHHRDGSAIYLNVEKDLYYIVNQSLRLDFLIVLKTLRVLWQGLHRKATRHAQRSMASLEREEVTA